jgi:hypothetical protein
VFELNTDNEYFVKTGTYSSKFDFRNCRVAGDKEVRELGEYLLFIHSQAVRMADPLNNVSIYGVSTTNEWVVREFIPDDGTDPTIYHGLPLRTEYRAFVDFDTDTVLGIHPYWDPEVMKNRFDRAADSDIDAAHDAVTYRMNENRLKKSYDANKDRVVSHLENVIKDVNLEGQWSVDIMQNGDDFWLIDMAVAENSAFYEETVPERLRHPMEENWLPDLSDR